MPKPARSGSIRRLVAQSLEAPYKRTTPPFRREARCRSARLEAARKSRPRPCSSRTRRRNCAHAFPATRDRPRQNRRPRVRGDAHEPRGTSGNHLLRVARPSRRSGALGRGTAALPCGGHADPGGHDRPATARARASSAAAPTVRVAAPVGATHANARCDRVRRAAHRDRARARGRGTPRNRGRRW